MATAQGSYCGQTAWSRGCALTGPSKGTARLGIIKGGYRNSGNWEVWNRLPMVNQRKSDSFISAPGENPKALILRPSRAESTASQ